jgi:hypothetical protein
MATESSVLGTFKFGTTQLAGSETAPLTVCHAQSAASIISLEYAYSLSQTKIIVPFECSSALGTFQLGTQQLAGCSLTTEEVSNSVVAQSQALIISSILTRRGYAQSAALITTFIKSMSAQSQVAIYYVLGTSYAQSQTYVIGSNFGVAESAARIRVANVKQVFSNSMAYVIIEGEPLMPAAQSQVSILSPEIYAWAQSSYAIRPTVGLAQSRAYVESFVVKPLALHSIGGGGGTLLPTQNKYLDEIGKTVKTTGTETKVNSSRYQNNFPLVYHTQDRCTSLGTGNGGNYTLDDFNRVRTGTLGNTSSDNYPWVTDSNTISSYGVDGQNAYFNSFSDGSRGSFYIEPVTGVPWINPTFSFYARFRTVRDSCDMGPFRSASFSFILEGGFAMLYFTVNMNTEWGSYGVQDGHIEGASAQTTKTDWSEDGWYTLEGYANDTTGAKIRVYAESESPPDWTSFTYSSGQRIGIGPSCKWVLSVDDLSYYALLNFDYIIFNSANIPYSGIAYYAEFDIPTPKQQALLDISFSNISTPGGGSVCG